MIPGIGETKMHAQHIEWGGGFRRRCRSNDCSQYDPSRRVARGEDELYARRFIVYPRATPAASATLDFQENDRTAGRLISSRRALRAGLYLCGEQDRIARF